MRYKKHSKQLPFIHSYMLMLLNVNISENSVFILSKRSNQNRTVEELIGKVYHTTIMQI